MWLRKLNDISPISCFPPTTKMPSSIEVAALLTQRIMTSHYAKRHLMSNPEFSGNIWLRVVNREKENNAKLTKQCEAACIIGFSARCALPTDSARIVASFINHPVSDRTLMCISRLVSSAKQRDRTLNGRGGYGLCSHHLYQIRHQRPHLLFSQYDFKREIREQAHRSLYRRLTLQGTLDERLSSYFLILLNKL